VQVRWHWERAASQQTKEKVKLGARRRLGPSRRGVSAGTESQTVSPGRDGSRWQAALLSQEHGGTWSRGSEDICCLERDTGKLERGRRHVDWGEGEERQRGEGDDERGASDAGG